MLLDVQASTCTMAGQPFKVGRFAHSLRIRLMREHLGVDVDAMYEEDLMASEPVKPAHEQEEWDPDVEQEYGKEHGVTHIGKGYRRTATKALFHDVVDGVEQGMNLLITDRRLVLTSISYTWDGRRRGERHGYVTSQDWAKDQGP